MHDKAPAIFEDAVQYRFCSILTCVIDLKEHCPENMTVDQYVLPNCILIWGRIKTTTATTKKTFTLSRSQKDLRRSGILTLKCFVLLPTKIICVQM